MQTDSIRIFKNPILEAMTHVHPIIPLILWAPIAFYASYLSLTINGLSFIEFLLWGSLGLFVWTLTEYTLHRYMFHWNPSHAWGKRFVYLFHFPL